MNIPEIVVAVLAVIVAAAGGSAYFKASAGKQTIQLLQTNIDAYKDAEKLKDGRIIYLEGIVVAKDETIKNLNKVIKNGN